MAMPLTLMSLAAMAFSGKGVLSGGVLDDALWVHQAKVGFGGLQRFSGLRLASQKYCVPTVRHLSLTPVADSEFRWWTRW